ncbi:MAG: hypothetical protein M3O95_04440, partial [Candidatus Dormibacteraeota bacterium]|nr:hypothetical protein [Candidatus Dormibacteraeota bacterium]
QGGGSHLLGLRFGVMGCIPRAAGANGVLSPRLPGSAPSQSGTLGQIPGGISAHPVWRYSAKTQR